MNPEIKQYKYEIGGKTYIQRPLVLGQLMQLSEVMRRDLPREIDAVIILDILSKVLPTVAAILFTEEGMPVKEKDIAIYSALFMETVNISMVKEVWSRMFMLEPDNFLLRWAVSGNGADHEKLDSWIEIGVTLLEKGDTKNRDGIIWNYTFEEVLRQLSQERLLRNVMNN